MGTVWNGNQLVRSGKRRLADVARRIGAFQCDIGKYALFGLYFFGNQIIEREISRKAVVIHVDALLYGSGLPEINAPLGKGLCTDEQNNSCYE